MQREQLQTIAERVVRVEPVESRERLIVNDHNARSLQPATKRLQVGHKKRRVSLSRGREIILNSEVNSRRIGFEPTPTAPFEIRWLVHPRESEKALVESHSIFLATGRHRQLNMVQSDNRHRWSIAYHR